MTSILVFYGFSGNPRRPSPSFPDGTDYDTSFKLVAETLADSLARLFPGNTVQVKQAWTKDVIVTELQNAASPVGQVHIVGHGDVTGVSLGYHFDGWTRLGARVRKWDAAPGTDDEKAVGALRDEDALLSGLFSRGLDRATVAAIKAKLAPGVTWQIWGCWAGYPVTTFGDDPGILVHPALARYFKRFNFGAPQVDGVAVDIAKALGVICTAAIDGWGLSFWHGKPDKTIERNGTATPARKPFWLWNTPGSRFVSYDSTGSLLAKPLIFGVPRDPPELRGGAPPTWLTSLYWP